MSNFIFRQAPPAVNAPSLTARAARPRSRAGRSRPRAGQSAEQRAAFAHLRDLAGPHRLRVVADPEGFPVIPGRHGVIEWAGSTNGQLAAYTTRRGVRPRLLGMIPGVIRHQVGDDELRVLFPLERLPEIAELLRARRRRTLSPEAARRLGARTAYRGTSGGQDRVPRPGEGGGFYTPEASS